MSSKLFAGPKLGIEPRQLEPRERLSGSTRACLRLLTAAAVVCVALAALPGAASASTQDASAAAAKGVGHSDANQISVRGIPRTCVRRSFKVVVSVLAIPGVRRVTVFIDGKFVLTATRGSFTVPVGLGRLEAGRHRLRVVVALSPSRRVSTRTISITRSFFKCASRPQFTG